MLDAIKHGLGNIINFTGRDARQPFWYYVLFAYIATTMFSMVAMVPAMIDMFRDIINAAKAGSSPEVAQQVMANSMSGLFGSVGWVSMVVGAAFIVLLAASLVRRLHDSDMSGWWALLPGGLQAIGIALMPSQLAAIADVMSDPAAMNDAAWDFSSPLATYGIFLNHGTMLDEDTAAQPDGYPWRGVPPTRPDWRGASRDTIAAYVGTCRHSSAATRFTQ